MKVIRLLSLEYMYLYCLLKYTWALVYSNERQRVVDYIQHHTCFTVLEANDYVTLNLDSRELEWISDEKDRPGEKVFL